MDAPKCEDAERYPGPQLHSDFYPELNSRVCSYTAISSCRTDNLSQIDDQPNLSDSPVVVKPEPLLLRPSVDERTHDDYNEEWTSCIKREPVECRSSSSKDTADVGIPTYISESVHAIDGHQSDAFINGENLVDPDANSKSSENAIISGNDSSMKKADSYLCHVCGKSLLSKRTLRQHIRLVHERAELSLCDLCGKIINGKANLRNHIQSMHEKLKPYPCHLCDRFFARQFTVRSHIRSVHEKSTSSVMCPLCGKSLRNAHTLRSHTKFVHEGYRPIICPKCGRGLPSSYCLRLHLAAVHEKLKQYACGICEKVFGYPSDVRNHMIAVHEDKGYFCEQCGRSFCNKNVLEQHILCVHEKSKPFVCRFCKKSFGRVYNLQTHISSVHEKKAKLPEPISS